MALSGVSLIENAMKNHRLKSKLDEIQLKRVNTQTQWKTEHM